LRARPTSLRAGSVSEDWQTPLSAEKSRAYHHILDRLEIAYVMFSVNLDEALGMRRSARLEKSFQLLMVTPELCERLSRPLIAALRSMHRHARHFGVIPHLAPLDPQNFRGPRSQRVARYNSLFGKVLLTRRSQFVAKIETLAELTDELSSTFQSTAEELLNENSLQLDHNWDVLDAAHFDLNTCLRETVVLLKCFLLALPDRQISQFQDLFRHQLASSRPSVPISEPALAHRRMALIKGQ
jgi:hypothetical protein